jgi:hypothetical protein
MAQVTSPTLTGFGIGAETHCRLHAENVRIGDPFLLRSVSKSRKYGVSTKSSSTPLARNAALTASSRFAPYGPKSLDA